MVAAAGEREGARQHPLGIREADRDGVVQRTLRGRFPEQARHALAGPRAEQTESPVRAVGVLDLDLFAEGVPLDVVGDGDAPSRTGEAQKPVRERVQDDPVDEPSLGGDEGGRGPLPRPERAEILGREAVQEIAGVLARDQEPAQVRAVGEHGVLARRAVLGLSTGRRVLRDDHGPRSANSTDGGSGITPDSWARRRNVSMARRPRGP